MNVTINRDGCIACGLCVRICPEVFWQERAGAKAQVHQNPPPKEAEEGVTVARDRCPVSVISID